MASLLNLRGRIHSDVLRMIRVLLTYTDVECYFTTHGCAGRDVDRMGLESARDGHVERLEWLRKGGNCKLMMYSIRWYDAAICDDQVDAVRWFNQTLGIFYPTVPFNFTCAVGYSAKKTFRWFVSFFQTKNVPVDFCTLIAAKKGSLDILKALAECDLIDDRHLLRLAARGGHLPVLQWAYARCPQWTPATALELVGTRNTALVTWALDHGCPCELFMLHAAIDNSDVPMQQLLRERMN